jgi:hypothetical protein
MIEARLILIAAPELIPALRERVGADDQILTFADSEPLRALEAIVSQRPRVIALERLFAASPRGAALIARIKADSTLDASEIRVLSHDSNYQRVSRRHRDLPPPRVLVKPAPVLDRGTRRAPRFRINESADAGIDGQPARLVDLSVLGVQLVGPDAIRPNQLVTVRLGPAASPLVLTGTVVWSRQELSRKGPASRVGIDFIDPDQPAVGAFIEANRQD